MSRKIFLLFIIIFIFSHCTHNPFDNDYISSTISEINGRVLLEDHKSPEIIHVWLEGFDLSTHPDKNGNFKFQIAGPSLQPYTGLTGSYKIFFFIADYWLDSATVVVNNGLLMPSQGDLDENGNLRQTKILNKKLRILITVSPDSVSLDSTAALSLELRLEATMDTVYIHYPDKAAGPLSILYFRNLSDKQAPIKIFENAPYASSAPLIADTISTNPIIWSAGVRFEDVGLKKGKYQIIPFFIIDHPRVPPELLNNIGNLIDKPTHQFIEVPTYRDGGVFTIVGIGKNN